MSTVLGQMLLVDDDEPFRERLAMAFRDRGYAVRTAGDYDAAMASAREESPDLGVVDLRMPGRSGLEVVRDLVALVPAIEIVVLTGYGSIPTAVDAVKLGAVGYLQKPANSEMILAAFERAPLAEVPDYEAPSLDRAEWEHISRVLADCNGNVSRAARQLGLHRRTLQRKLAKHPPRD